MSNSFNNIAGGPFQPYISKQIETRKQFLKDSNIKKENKHLLYQNNKNSWIRITSNTNVSKNHPLYKKYNLSDNSLAEKYILQGGLIDKNTNFKNRGGISLDGSYNLLPIQPLGPKPMPGLLSLNVYTSGKLGTLQYADIKFICYDLEQLDIMDALYMKLGFSIVIEWGHTVYLDNNKNLNNPIPLDLSKYNNKEELLIDIQKKKVMHCGNYDAILGVISNFGFIAQPNGSYLCSIKVVGAGDVLESLKINHSPINLIESTDIISSQVSQKNLSNLSKVLFNLKQYGIKYSKNKINNFSPRDPIYRNILNTNFKNGIYNFINFNSSGVIEGDDISIRGNHYSLLNGLSKPDDISKLNSNLYNLTTINYFIEDNTSNVNPSFLQYQSYITLGHLLSLITSQCLLYSQNKPYIYIDFNDSLNYCYTFTNQFFLDPQVCIIPNNYNSDIINTKYNIFPNQNVKKLSDEYDLEDGWVDDEISKYISKYNNFLKSDNPKNRANLMYININIDYVMNLLESLSLSNNGDVYLSTFLNKILEDISYSLGGENNFRILIDDSSKSLRIIDDNRLNSLSELDNNLYNEIPLFGNESFVYNYNFTSKISPNMGSMIVISSQANPSVYTEDMFSLSNLSRGLTDKLMKNKIIINDIRINEELKIDTNTIKLLDQYFKNIYQGDKNSFKYNKNTYNSIMNIWKELLKNYINQKNVRHQASTLIPLDFTLEIDGLSGIIPNSAFVIPVNLLPSSYKTRTNKQKIAFIIHSIEQNFDSERWTTKLTGQTMNIRFDEEDAREVAILNLNKNNILRNNFIITDPSNVVQKEIKIQNNIYRNGTLPDNILRTIKNENKYIGLIQSDNGRIRLYTNASIALDQLLEKAEQDGIILKINSAYRTLQNQINVRIFNAPVDKKNDEYFIMNASSSEFAPPTAKPGTSNHGFGLAVDFANKSNTKLSENMSEYLWVKNNAPKYGFKRIPSEAWHWEYQL